jgi:hypothetical protein
VPYIYILEDEGFSENQVISKNLSEIINVFKNRYIENIENKHRRNPKLSIMYCQNLYCNIFEKQNGYKNLFKIWLS